MPPIDTPAPQPPAEASASCAQDLQRHCCRRPTPKQAAVVGIFVVAAFLTPPDPFSQVALGLSIFLLYEVSIWSVTLAEKKAAAPAEAP